ncbi:MAG: TonB-dependent receptor [Microscillaceae bacterium]|jgi:outer membrane receptor for ferrienterochelin and colicins|nr:TonB-dependent receptor [Microscillaceae bacterium]
MQFRILVILFYWCVFQPLNAQNTGIEGKLSNAGEPVIGANIVLQGTNFGTSSNAEGFFRLTDIPLGSYQLEISAIGYKKTGQKIALSQNLTLQLGEIQLETDVLGLANIVVTAGRYAQNRQEASVIVNVTDQRIFQAVQAISLSEGLSFSPGLRLENNCQNCGFTALRMNGLAGPYTQILIDGRAIFSALNGVYGLDQIPTAMIDRIEVVRGGGSALYGANAIAGTVNVITKEPINSGFQINTNTALIAGKAWDNSLSWNGNLVSENGKSGISLFGLSRHRDFWDANDDGFSEITQLNNLAWGLKTYLKPSTRQKITLELHNLNEYRRGGNLFERPAHLTDIAEQLKHRVWGGQVSYEAYSKNLKDKISLYSSLQHTNRDSYYGGGGNSEDAAARAQALLFYGKTYDFSAVSGGQYTRDFRWGTWVSGAEWQHNRVNDQMPGYGRNILQTVNNWGFYNQLEIKPLTRLTLAVGMRFDWIDIRGNYNFGEAEQKQNHLQQGVWNPRLNILYAINPDLQLRAGYARGFRAPQAFNEDLHIETLNGAAQFIRLSPTLRPETSDSFTASLDFAPKWGNTQAVFTLEGFYTRLQNPFINEFTGETLPQSGASIMEKRNGNGARVAGLNFEFRIAPGTRWQLQTGGTWQLAQYRQAEVILQDTDNQILIESKQILRTPNLYGYFNWTYHLSKKLSTYLSGVYTDRMWLTNERTQTLHHSPRFFELNLKGNYDLDFAKKYCLQINWGVQNLFNSFQRDLETGINRDAGYIYGPMRPRTFFIGLKLER